MKKKVLALSLVFSLAALSGCANGKETTTATQTSAPQTSGFITIASTETNDTKEIEPEREIKTSAQTYEELIAYFLTAFCEKDTEAVKAFGVDYDESFNDLCKALDDAGNLPDDLSKIELSPEMFEIYHVYNSVTEHWEAAYPLANGHFTFYIKFDEYDYITKTYSIERVKCIDDMGLSFLGLSGYRDAAASGEAVEGGSKIEAVDITPYLDTKESKPETKASGTEIKSSEREIKSSASTYEEIIAYFLTAFCEKDTEALESFGVDYDKSFNVLCKALDDTGNLPDDLSEIELSPELFEVYYIRNSAFTYENWEATYPLVNGKFTFHFKFSEYDYVSKTYSVQSVKCKDRLSSDSLSSFRKCSDSGEPLPGGIVVERLDITDYLD